MMNRKGVEESNEKQEAFMKDNLVKTIHLPYKLFPRAKILSEEKKRRRGKNFLSFLCVEPVCWFNNWLFLACFLRCGKTEKQKQLQTNFQFPSQYEN